VPELQPLELEETGKGTIFPSPLSTAISEMKFKRTDRSLMARELQKKFQRDYFCDFWWLKSLRK